MANTTTNNNTNNQSQKTDWKSREVGALWEKSNDNGVYYTGHVKNSKGEVLDIVVYPNRFAGENPLAPQLRIYKGIKRDAPTAKDQAPARKPAVIKTMPLRTAAPEEVNEGDVI